MVNSIFFGKNSVNSMQLKVFSKLDCFLKLEFVKLEFQPKIEFEKLDLHLMWIKKKKVEPEFTFNKLKFHALKKKKPDGTRGKQTRVQLFFLNGTQVY